MYQGAYAETKHGKSLSMFHLFIAGVKMTQPEPSRITKDGQTERKWMIDLLTRAEKVNLKNADDGIIIWLSIHHPSSATAARPKPSTYPSIDSHEA